MRRFAPSTPSGPWSRSHRPSHELMRRLLAEGYEVVPVNPGEREVLGRRAYPDLASVPGRVDLVDVFRRSEFTPGVARDAVAVGARVLWLQLGVVSEEAAQIARSGGLIVVMDRCLIVEHERLIGRPFGTSANPGGGDGSGDPHAPDGVDRVGLCRECRQARWVPAPRALYWMCRRSLNEPEFERYPRLPVRACPGFERMGVNENRSA
jgi:predicted CoA-binding protein